MRHKQLVEGYVLDYGMGGGAVGVSQLTAEDGIVRVVDPCSGAGRQHGGAYLGGDVFDIRDVGLVMPDFKR